MNNRKFNKIIFALIFVFSLCFGRHILIPMDEAQNDHLKAYGVAYYVLQQSADVEWLLNYRGGSFCFDEYSDFTHLCIQRNVSYSILEASDYQSILSEIEESNMSSVLLEKAPRIAVYTPTGKLPWDDAVTMALSYAEIKYDKIYDPQILKGGLKEYDWLHLHHEDFTGQYGKFYGNYHNSDWYIQEQISQEAMAKDLGFSKVSKLKLAVAETIRSFIQQGGFLFAMCAATDSYDIALAAHNTDICEREFDGDPVESGFNDKMDYGYSLAFTGFNPISNPFLYEFSDIDIPPGYAPQQLNANRDYFSLFDFSAKFDKVPCMLTQNHTSLVKGFMGQTTYFKRSLIKKNVLILGDVPDTEKVRYIHGNLGKGTFTYYGGHDPEDYKHFVGDPKTRLELHPNSPGYRLILNNVLFPAAKKQERKT